MGERPPLRLGSQATLGREAVIATWKSGYTNHELFLTPSKVRLASKQLKPSCRIEFDSDTDCPY